MKTPPSPHFTPVDLRRYFNARRQEVDAGLRNNAGDSDWSVKLTGLQTFRGIPFLFGDEVGQDVLALRPGEGPTIIVLEQRLASYLIFVQAVTDRASSTPPGFGSISPATLPADRPNESNDFGELVSTYSLEYVDGSEIKVPVLRRFGIQ